MHCKKYYDNDNNNSNQELHVKCCTNRTHKLEIGKIKEKKKNTSFDPNETGSVVMFIMLLEKSLFFNEIYRCESSLNRLLAFVVLNCKKLFDKRHSSCPTSRHVKWCFTIKAYLPRTLLRFSIRICSMQDSNINYAKWKK